jgi:methylmalonyl-CoA carboxyltransferase 12S subunit
MPGKSSFNIDMDLDILLRRIEELEARVQRIEEQRSVPTQAAPDLPASQPVLAEDWISDDTVAVITAAVAAYLGVRARVRHISLNGSDAWAQQGRASIMASHRWAMHRT